MMLALVAQLCLSHQPASGLPPDIPCRLESALDANLIVCRPTPAIEGHKLIKVRLVGLSTAPNRALRSQAVHLVLQLGRQGAFDVVPAPKQAKLGEITAYVNVAPDPHDPGLVMRSLGCLLLSKGLSRFEPDGTSSDPRIDALRSASEQARSMHLGLYSRARAGK